MHPSIVIIQGDPDPKGFNFRHGLAAAYSRGARESNFSIKTIDVARMAFPLVRTHEDMQVGEPPEVIKEARAQIDAATHVVVVCPLWLGEIPAYFRGFLEQAFRPCMTFEASGSLRRSARVVVTTAKTSLVSKLLFNSRSVWSLRTNILDRNGIGRIRQSLIVVGKEPSDGFQQKYFRRMYALGKAGH